MNEIILKPGTEFRPGSNLRGIDLSYKNLKEVDLSGRDLTGTNLQYSNLIEANLRRANLTDAVLRGADLMGAHLEGANLTNVDLSEVTITFIKIDKNTILQNVTFPNPPPRTNYILDLSVDLNGKHLPGINFIEAKIRGLELSGADLQGANFTNATFHKIDLSSANLQGAYLTNAVFNDVDLKNAKLQRADLTNVNFRNTKLSGVKLQGADLTNAKFSNLLLGGIDFTDTMLDLTRYGLPQDLFPTETLISLTNPDNLTFLLCLRDKIRNLNIKDLGSGDGSGHGLPSIHQGLNKFTRNSKRNSELKSHGKIATQVLHYSRFGRHIFDFFKLTQAQFDEVKRRMIDSLPLLYSFNYENLGNRDINEFCAEIVEKRMKDLVKQLLNSGKGKANTKRRRKLSFRKKASK